MFLKSYYSFGEYLVQVYVDGKYVAQADSSGRKFSRRQVRVLAKKRARS